MAEVLTGPSKQGRKDRVWAVWGLKGLEYVDLPTPMEAGPYYASWEAARPGQKVLQVGTTVRVNTRR